MARESRCGRVSKQLLYLEKCSPWASLADMLDKTGTHIRIAVARRRPTCLTEDRCSALPGPSWRKRLTSFCMAISTFIPWHASASFHQRIPGTFPAESSTVSSLSCTARLSSSADASKVTHACRTYIVVSLAGRSRWHSQTIRRQKSPLARLSIYCCHRSGEYNDCKKVKVLERRCG